MTQPIALVVGGGSGIGADAARLLAERGFGSGDLSRRAENEQTEAY